MEDVIKKSNILTVNILLHIIISRHLYHFFADCGTMCCPERKCRHSPGTLIITDTYAHAGVIRPGPV